MKVAINGLGRIGRYILKAGLNDLEFVGVNDVFDIPTMVHLLKYDSVFGRTGLKIEARGEKIALNGHEVPVMNIHDPAKLPWKELGAEIVFECTGKFTNREKASAHLTAGAKKVIVSAPAKDADLTVVMGVNHKSYDPEKHHIISNASCTTNCLAPIVAVLHKHFGVERGFMTTVHSYTSDQRLMDSPHKDLRRARAATLSQIPTTTGAAKAVGLVIPELKGKLDGIAIRVPTPNVSCIDLAVICKKQLSVEEVNDAFKEAANGELKGILGFSDEELVSIDFLGDPRSGIVDGPSTKVIENLVKIIAWYDNEAGFSMRMIDFAKYIGSK